MSVRIGEVGPRLTGAQAHVWASEHGVEVKCDPEIPLDPVQARNFAALLVRGANEVERMRRRRAVRQAARTP